MSRSSLSDTHLVLIRVHRFCTQPFRSSLSRLVDVFADPDVSVQPQYEVYIARQRDKVRL